MKCSCCGSEITPIDGHCSVCGAPVLEEIDYENVDVQIDEPVKETAKDAGKKVSNSKTSSSRKKKTRSNKNSNKNDAKDQKRVTGKALYIGMGLLAAIMVILGIIGDNSDDGSEEGPALSSADTAVYKEEPSKILEVEGVIYNDAGDYLEGMYAEDETYYRFSYNKDHSAGAFVDGRENALYVSTDLQTVPVKSDALWAGISYNGEYMYVFSRVDYNYELSLVNIKSGKTYVIDDDAYHSIALSPDGTKVAYMKYSDDYSCKYLYIAGIDMEAELICLDVDGVRAISDDGSTVFYEVYDEDYNAKEYVWHDGKEIELTPKRSGYFLFNRDCTETIYKNGEINYYYKSGMDEPKAIDCAYFYKIVMDVYKESSDAEGYDGIVYDTDTFAGGLIHDGDGNVYLINDDYTLTKLGHNYNYVAFHAKRTDKDIYIVEDDKELIRYERDASGKLERKKLLGDVNIDEVEINDDASIVWCYYYESGKTVLCSIDENGEITAISDKDENMDIRKMYWDSDTQKLYMYGDNTLTALSKDGEQEVISKKCKRLSKDNYDYPGILTFTDSNDRDYVSVFGQFVMVED